MKELKNKVDSIRRTLKAKNLALPSSVIESKILELCPDFPTDWCDDIRTEVIKSLIKNNQSTELAPVNSTTSLQNINPNIESDETDMDTIDSNTSTTAETVINEGAITTQQTSQLAPTIAEQPKDLAFIQASELIQSAIQAAPNEIRQNLILEYAEREFKQASELILFKQEIDAQIDSFLAMELKKQQEARSKAWEQTYTQITEKGKKEVSDRATFRQDFLKGLQARIAEFKS